MGLLSMSEESPLKGQWVRILALILIAITIALIPGILGGCAMFKGQPRIKVGSTVITPPADAGKPATLATDETRTGIVIPKDTPVILTKVEASPATDKTLFVPAKWVYQFTPTQETRLEAVSATLAANTGTVDTTVALRRVEAAEARVWLYASLAAAVGAGVFLWLKYPTPALICGGASGIFLLVWKISDLPSWFWAVGAAALVGAVALFLGHERGEKHAASTAPQS
jgi:hypothetical protein